MPNLLLDFTGLCGFVPKRTDPGNPDYAATVLLVSRGAQQGADLDDLHLPALVFPEEKRVKTAGLRAPDEFYYDEKNNKMGVCWLDDQEITISGLAQEFKISDGSINSCPTADNQQYFSWVAPMPRIDPQWGTVDLSCMYALPKPPQPISSAVGARVQLTSGRLYTKGFLNEASAPYQCGFVRNGPLVSRLQQAIADQVGLDASIAGTQVTFVSKPLRDGKAYPNLTLDAGSSDLSVSIKNLPVFDLIGFRPSPPFIIGKPPDLHFEHLFRFSDNGPAPGEGYVYYPVVKCSSLPLVQSPKCPPASFSPVIG